MDSSKNLKSFLIDKKFYLALSFVTLLYLFIRLCFFGTIEFGYDQPRLAVRVLQFVENKNILDTQRFAESSPWGNITWGPSLFLFYAPFLVLWKDPAIASNMIAVFNSLSVFVIMYLGKKYFSETVGVVAGLLLATHPWWYIFSRMIYQPTPVLTITVISMLLFFIVYEKPRSMWLSLLVLSWVFLIELYLHTLAFVSISFCFLLITKNIKLVNRFLLIGMTSSLLLLLPYFYNSNFYSYLPDKNKSNQTDKIIVLDKLKNMSVGLFQMSAGNNFKYQLGYSYESFILENPSYELFQKFSLAITLLAFLYVLISIFLTNNDKPFRIIILLWFLSPILFLMPLKLPDLIPLPRYFLVSLPSAILIIGIFINDIKNRINSRVILMLPLFLSIVWIMFIFKYERYISELNFKEGHLSPYSDTQIYYVRRAINIAYADSVYNSYEQTVISNDHTQPTDYFLEWGMDYLLKYEYKINRNLDDKQSKGYYLIDYSTSNNDPKFTKIDSSGPISIYKYKN